MKVGLFFSGGGRGFNFFFFICTCGWLDYRVGFIVNVEFVFMLTCIYIFVTN